MPEAIGTLTFEEAGNTTLEDVSKLSRHRGGRRWT
jgi:hypothetical protein